MSFKFIILLSLFLSNTTFAYRGCNEQEIKAIQNSERAVLSRLVVLNRDWKQVNLMGVKKNFIDPQNRKWTNRDPKHYEYQNYWYEMAEVWSKMQDKFFEVEFVCKTANSRFCKNSDTIAYVNFILGVARPKINVCPRFFNSLLSDQSSTIFHELSHYAVNTEDSAMDWAEGDSINLSGASKDAYHIEQFMDQDPIGILRRVIWTWFWPNS